MWGKHVGRCVQISGPAAPATLALGCVLLPLKQLGCFADMQHRRMTAKTLRPPPSRPRPPAALPGPSTQMPTPPSARSGPARAGGQPAQPAFSFQLNTSAIRISGIDHCPRHATLRPCPASRLSACYSCLPLLVSGLFAYTPHRIRSTHPSAPPSAMYCVWQKASSLGHRAVPHVPSTTRATPPATAAATPSNVASRSRASCRQLTLPELKQLVLLTQQAPPITQENATGTVISLIPTTLSRMDTGTDGGLEEKNSKAAAGEPTLSPRAASPPAPPAAPPAPPQLPPASARAPPRTPGSRPPRSAACSGSAARGRPQHGPCRRPRPRTTHAVGSGQDGRSALIPRVPGGNYGPLPHPQTTEGDRCIAAEHGHQRSRACTSTTSSSATQAARTMCFFVSSCKLCDVLALRPKQTENAYPHAPPTLLCQPSV